MTQGIVLTIFGRTDVGKARTRDEDAFLIADLSDPSPLRPTQTAVELEVSQRGILMAVSDGMGGAQAGEVASALVLSALREQMSSISAANAEVALRSAIEEANRQVFRTAQSTDRVGMGATLTAVLFHGVHAYVAQIGDSRAYLVRGRRMVQITHDQSYVQQLVDLGTLTREQSETSQYKNIILQAMGAKPSIVVALNRISVRRHDRFLLCSDGLTGKLQDEEMVNVILHSETPEPTCARLILAAVEHGAEDDITLILAEVNGQGVPVMTDAERLSLETSKVFEPT